jgi:hypothetical protein
MLIAHGSHVERTLLHRRESIYIHRQHQKENRETPLDAEPKGS